jgi:hypothetical protein
VDRAGENKKAAWAAEGNGEFGWCGGFDGGKSKVVQLQGRRWGRQSKVPQTGVTGLVCSEDNGVIDRHGNLGSGKGNIGTAGIAQQWTHGDHEGGGSEGREDNVNMGGAAGERMGSRSSSALWVEIIKVLPLGF